MNVFNTMPLAAVISGRMLCVHGGISRSLKSLDDIRNIERPVEIPNSGLLCDLLWSEPYIPSMTDPEASTTEDWVRNVKSGIVTYKYSERAVREFLYKCNLIRICRAHTVRPN